MITPVPERLAKIGIRLREPERRMKLISISSFYSYIYRKLTYKYNLSRSYAPSGKFIGRGEAVHKTRRRSERMGGKRSRSLPMETLRLQYPGPRTSRAHSATWWDTPCVGSQCFAEVRTRRQPSLEERTPVLFRVSAEDCAILSSVRGTGR